MTKAARKEVEERSRREGEQLSRSLSDPGRAAKRDAEAAPTPAVPAKKEAGSPAVASSVEVPARKEVGTQTEVVDVSSSPEQGGDASPAKCDCTFGSGCSCHWTSRRKMGERLEVIINYA